MLYLYQSNHLDTLQVLLSRVMALQAPADPFVEQQVLVQSPGMAQWLKLQLAEQQGIVANVSFPLPASFIWQMFHLVLQDVPEQSPFNKQAMTWRLMRLLPQRLLQAEFKGLQDYLQGEQQAIESRKLWQLAQKIADIYDQYLVYRSEWTSAWEAGDDLSEVSASQPWQPILWRDLVDDTVSTMDSAYHRGNLYIDFIEQLALAKQAPEGLPENIFVFGISALPPAYLQALDAMAKHCDVHLFLTNPSKYYWGDLRDVTTLLSQQAELHQVGNPLLASMGKLGRDYIEMLQPLNKQETDVFVSNCDADDKPSRLLGLIQDDILELRDPVDYQRYDSSEHKRVISAADQSVQLHLCHSPRRELEVLHDQLLAMFEQDSSLSPRDVIVMVPDVNRYGPMIQAVFGSASAETYLPFAISDRSVTQENPVLLSFLELLALPQKRKSAAEILALLEVPAIMRRFELSDAELKVLRQWVKEAGVRWGLDGADRSRWLAPDEETHSWLFGLKRMLLGYAMSSQQGLYQGVLAYDEVQGQMALAVGKLADFIEQLLQLEQDILQPASAAQWRLNLQSLLDNMYQFSSEDEAEYLRLLTLFEELQEQSSNSGFVDDIEPELVLDYCSMQLNAQRGSQRFLAGQINFCTLLPMRAIPFKVVCLLGMNDSDYPRSVPSMGFDLMAQNPAKRGDRSRRDDDRYLFLEALLAAQQRLYLSYIAHSAKDNSEQTPSVLLAELCDYIAQSCVLAGDEALDVDSSGQRLLAHLSHQHPLQPFSPLYYQSNEALFSYAQRWLPAVLAQQQSALAPDVRQSLEQQSDLTELSMEELLAFSRSPIAYFYQRRLKVNFPRLSEQLEETEPFLVEGLSAYSMKQYLLQQQLAEADKQQQFEHLHAAGALPHGGFGQVWFEQQWQELSGLAQQLQPLLASGAMEAQALNCQLQYVHEQQRLDCRLSAWLKHRYAAGLVSYRPGRLRGQDLLASWLWHLMLHATGASSRSYLLGLKEAWQWPPMAATDAQACLSDWLMYMQQAAQQPLLLPVESAWQWISQCKDKKSGEISFDEDNLAKARRAARLQFAGGPFTRAEGDDPYIQAQLSDLENTWPEFEQAAKVLLEPMLVHLEAYSDD
ncbi:exodeoxyribonuclease V subunit gamma [Agarivorans gilvus]|uniref:RecBCD enzyme subunit RecC n=1 Tax=Agarivorans gilvus TaxID=680279 RepID=A0ABQ1I3B2_9ALTE|nr:exodeoxyribonuclease V subunit gamma [Agarivorans gilvus]GGB07521.1 RecBCD enzyme subunit RecC [Agarivorans gilvus]